MNADITAISIKFCDGFLVSFWRVSRSLAIWMSSRVWCVSFILVFPVLFAG